METTRYVHMWKIMTLKVSVSTGIFNMQLLTVTQEELRNFLFSISLAKIRFMQPNLPSCGTLTFTLPLLRYSKDYIKYSFLGWSWRKRSWCDDARTSIQSLFGERLQFNLWNIYNWNYKAWTTTCLYCSCYQSRWPKTSAFIGKTGYIIHVLEF